MQPAAPTLEGCDSSYCAEVEEVVSSGGICASGLGAESPPEMLGSVVGGGCNPGTRCLVRRLQFLL